MGEKPMGRGAEETHEDEDLSGEWTGDDHGGDDPMAGAAGIITTRSNIKHSAGVTGAPAGESDDREDDGGDDPMAGAAGINTTRSNIKHSAGVTGAPAGESDDREDDGPTVTGEPIPGVPF